MKTKLTLLTLIASAAMQAQSSQVALMLGQQAVEVSASYTAPNELIYGLALSATSAQLTEYRANKNDRGKIHEFKGTITPAAFALIGGQFDDFSMIGKLGTAYVDQSINGMPESQNYYFAVGIALDYKLNGSVAVRASYDSVAGLLAGLTLHF